MIVPIIHLLGKYVKNFMTNHIMTYFSKKYRPKRGCGKLFLTGVKMGRTVSPRRPLLITEVTTEVGWEGVKNLGFHPQKKGFSGTLPMGVPEI